MQVLFTVYTVSTNMHNVCIASSLTCSGPDGGCDSGGGHGRYAVVVLGVPSLDGPQVAVASGPKAARQVQGFHSLGLHLAEHRLTHRFKLTIHLRLADLRGI